MQIAEFGAHVVPNLDYVTWLHKDQMALRAILTSLTEEVLAQVMLLSTTREVWQALEWMFSSGSKLRIMQLHRQLTNMRKNNMGATKYFHKVKNLSNTLGTLGTISKPLSNDKIVTYVLTGINNNYDPLVTSLTTRTEQVTLSNLYAHLMSFDTCLEQNNYVVQVLGASVNLASLDNCGCRGKSRGFSDSYTNQRAL